MVFVDRRADHSALPCCRRFTGGAGVSFPNSSRHRCAAAGTVFDEIVGRGCWRACASRSSLGPYTGDRRTVFFGTHGGDRDHCGALWYRTVLFEQARRSASSEVVTEGGAPRGHSRARGIAALRRQAPSASRGRPRQGPGRPRRCRRCPLEFDRQEPCGNSGFEFDAVALGSRHRRMPGGPCNDPAFAKTGRRVIKM